MRLCHVRVFLYSFAYLKFALGCYSFYPGLKKVNKGMNSFFIQSLIPVYGTISQCSICSFYENHIHMHVRGIKERQS